MREFARFCAKNGVHARPVQAVADDDRPDAYECMGAVASLERLTGHPAVRDYHLIIGVRVPLVASGSGELTERAERAIRRAKMHKPDRLAVEETERRARLPKD